MARRLFLCLALALLLGGAAPAAAFETSGYLKTLDIYVRPLDEAGLEDGAVSANRLRLEVREDLVDATFEAAAENLLLYTSPAGVVPLPGDSPNRALDLETDWQRDRRFADRLELDRFNLQGSALGLDWSVGRQAIGFGRLNLFSPLDIIAPFPPDTLDATVRPGVDAVRASRFIGMAGHLSLLTVFGDGAGLNSYLATAGGHLPGTDLLALTGRLRGRSMAGAGVATQAAGIGLKAEVTVFAGKDVGEPGGDLRQRFAVAAFEGEYQFDSGPMLFLEYLYNGAGASRPGDYPLALASAPYREGLAFLPGRHYLMAAPSWQFHPLATCAALVIWNLEDDSFLLRPLLDLSLADNLSLQLFWAVAQGRRPRQLAGLPVVLPRSEFGSAPDSGGLFLQFFF